MQANWKKGYLVTKFIMDNTVFLPIAQEGKHGLDE